MRQDIKSLRWLNDGASEEQIDHRSLHAEMSELSVILVGSEKLTDLPCTEGESSQEINERVNDGSTILSSSTRFVHVVHHHDE